ncbi:MAG: P-loop domain-containing protein [Nannocystaceae bacterium]|nr:ABC-ATPase domain-containing protein [bacterium]
MSTLDDLRALLLRIDGGGYGGYKRALGLWTGDDMDVALDHVQGDPFAAASVVRLRIRNHGFDAQQYRPGPRQVALCDLLLRRFSFASRNVERRGSGKSGVVQVDAGGAAMLARSGCAFVDDALELRIRVGLPARGRRVMGRAAVSLLLDALPRAAEAVRSRSVPAEDVQRWQRSALEHASLVEQLEDAGLVAFVADGSVLPRASGVDHAPLQSAVTFEAPPSLRVQLRDLDGGSVPGLGIPRGVTLIAGAGFHGKSTLLQAIAQGVLPHVPGDGRERVATVPSAMKLRSEDGRAVTGVDVRPFISALPGGRDTSRFETADASGSTSLAASILESVEAGSTALLLDEDTCATNLLVRDARMQALIDRDTITPLVDRVQQLAADLDVSTVLVVGGSGDYLDVADTVITMDEYRPHDASDRARRVCVDLPSQRARVPAQLDWSAPARIPVPKSLRPASSRGRSRVRAHGLRDLAYGDDTIVLDGLEQLVDPSQVRTLGVLLEWASQQPQGSTVAELSGRAVAKAQEEGLYDMRTSPELAAVRAQDVAAALNRLRGLRLDRSEGR